MMLTICFFGECGKIKETDVKYESGENINSNGKNFSTGKITVVAAVYAQEL